MNAKMKTTTTAAGVVHEGLVDGQLHRVFVPVNFSQETPPTHEINFDGIWHSLGNGNYARIVKKMKQQAAS